MRSRRRRAALHTLAGAYALDALERPDRARFERHLARCEACAHEVRGLRDTAALLGSAAAGSPPAGLRPQVLAAAAGTRQEPPSPLQGRPHARGQTGHGARLPLRQAALAAGAVSLAAAVTFGVLAAGMRHQLDRADERNQQVAAVLTARDAEMAWAPVTTGGRATAVMSHAKGMAVFSAKDLRALPRAHGYELWLMGPDGVRSAGMLPRPSHGMIAPVVVSGLAAGDRIGMTVEPGAGSPRPTAPPVAVLAAPAGDR